VILRFLTQILRRPVWLAGAACQSSGWVLQAAALDRGSLIVVQSLATLSLVLALPLGVRLTQRQISPRVWLDAAAIVVGIDAFLSVGSPTGGTATPSTTAWWAAARRRQPPLRSSCSSVAQGPVPQRPSSSGALRVSATPCRSRSQFVTLVGGGIATYLTS
jgi:hypothetical protein